MKKTLLLLSLLSLVSCATSTAPIDISDLVQNHSVYIMVSNEVPIPETAKYSWGPQYFKINKNYDIDLDAMNRRLRTNVMTELGKKGYVQAESTEEAEIIIGYAVALNSSIDERDLNKSYGDEFKFSFPLMPSDQARSFHKGALIIDVLDIRAKKLLWRGALVAEVDMGVSEKAKDERAGPIVRALLDSFPKPGAS